MRNLIFCCLLLTLAAAEVRCQTEESQPTTSSEGIQKRWNELGIWGAMSFNSPWKFGSRHNARFGELRLRFGRVLAASKSVAFEWTIDAVPLAILSNDRSTPLPTGTGVQNTRKSVYGAGLSPIGLKFNFRRQHRVQPFAEGTGGFLYFREDVPIPEALRFKFTFDLSGGIQIINGSRRAFTIGYKYKHLSNGSRSPINPGIDVQMVYAGFSIFK
jgi:Lipid A 3-O-deacylase (PagL)